MFRLGTYIQMMATTFILFSFHTNAREYIANGITYIKHGRCIGSGQFAKVYKAIDLNPTQLGYRDDDSIKYVLKIPHSTENIQSLEDDLLLHHNLIKYKIGNVHAFYDDEKKILVKTYIKGLSLYQLIKNSTITSNNIRQFGILIGNLVESKLRIMDLDNYNNIIYDQQLNRWEIIDGFIQKQSHFKNRSDALVFYLKIFSAVGTKLTPHQFNEFQNGLFMSIHSLGESIISQKLKAITQWNRLKNPEKRGHNTFRRPPFIVGPFFSIGLRGKYTY